MSSFEDGCKIFAKTLPVNHEKEWTKDDFENFSVIQYPDTKEYYAAAGYYDAIMKPALDPAIDAGRRESQKAEISSAVFALEALYNTSFDPRVSFIWYRALAKLCVFEDAAEVIGALHRGMKVHSGYLAGQVYQIQMYLKSQRILVEQGVEAEDKEFSLFIHHYSSETIKKCVLPKANIEGVNPIMHLLGSSAKCDDARLLRYIVLDTHRMEGDLSQISKGYQGLTKTLLSLGFSHAALKNCNIADQEHVLSVLTQSYNVVIELMAEFSKGTMGDKTLSITTEILLRMHHELLKTSRCKIVHICNKNTGETTPQFVLIATRRFKFYSNSAGTDDKSMPQFCPPAAVERDLKDLFSRLDGYLKANRDPFMVAAWAHHFFVSIHPFHDGNNRMARLLVTAILSKYKLLPLLVRLEDTLRYHEAISNANTGDIVSLANFFSSMQVQALMVTIAQDECSKIPSGKHKMCVQMAVDAAQTILAQMLPKSVVELTQYKNDDWKHGFPFTVGRKNSFCLAVSRMKDKAIYARLLFGPLKPWRRGHIAVYLQDEAENTMRLTCVDLLSRETISAEIEQFLKICTTFLQNAEAREALNG